MRNKNCAKTEATFLQTGNGEKGKTFQSFCNIDLL